ncbi:Uu.00g052340.m01.CDS01 [Anthostomella pinea]|uniref:Uu.00g052340.m01.CDS01 n=1 Tax=Anthostomella pinea TaxID=933095 RepID=A0AAI8VW81_9PEZI|nr:Uu.00g052340.m01.CDS01 [Anthostomella pinea]
MATNTASEKEAPLVEVIDQEEDFLGAFKCACAAFGHQTNDAIWTCLNPGWDTPEGQARGAAGMVKRWRSVTTDKNGNPNTVFLKATLPDQDGCRVIVGQAIWVQASMVDGHGEPPSDDIRSSMDPAALYPGDEAEQRYCGQLWRSLFRRRVEVVREKAASAANPPSVMVLDLCATDPAFQRRGVASALVRWGLDEVRRRRIPEATTEASSMGRLVYERLGFRPEGPEIAYEVDGEFASRERPSNVFMRTGGGS